MKNEFIITTDDRHVYVEEGGDYPTIKPIINDNATDILARIAEKISQYLTKVVVEGKGILDVEITLFEE